MLGVLRGFCICVLRPFRFCGLFTVPAYGGVLHVLVFWVLVCVCLVGLFGVWWLRFGLLSWGGFRLVLFGLVVVVWVSGGWLTLCLDFAIVCWLRALVIWCYCFSCW